VDARREYSTASPALTAVDALLRDPGRTRVGRWAGRALSLALILFALTIPHSIAAAHISLNLALLGWIARDLAERRFHFAATRLDLPIVGFSLLSILSAAFSLEPRTSLPKLLSLTLFGVVYLFIVNLHPRGVHLILYLLVSSALVGALFSLSEKALGRGMTIKAIAAGSPLEGSELRAGDVIWMIGRRRVSTLEAANEIIRGRPAGETLEIEALHEGDPLPARLFVTDELKARANPLGASVGAGSRQFRVSGFTRHFQTYAEQMQIFALLALGAVAVWWRQRRRQTLRLIVAGSLFATFTLALILTASRAVIASFLVAFVVVAIVSGGRRLWPAALGLTILIGGVSYITVSRSRTAIAIDFRDDSSVRRVAYMRAGLRVIPRRPLLGVGIDAHKRHWREWDFPGEFVTHTHSTPIQVAMDRGLPALACLVWLFASMWRLALRAYRGGTEPVRRALALGVFGALVGFSLSSLVNYNFGDAEVLLLLLTLWSLVSIAAQASETKKPQGDDPPAVSFEGHAP
jgi:hypothetical protein